MDNIYTFKNIEITVKTLIRSYHSKTLIWRDYVIASDVEFHMNHNRSLYLSYNSKKNIIEKLKEVIDQKIIAGISDGNIESNFNMGEKKLKISADVYVDQFCARKIKLSSLETYI